MALTGAQDMDLLVESADIGRGGLGGSIRNGSYGQEERRRRGGRALSKGSPS